MHVQSITRERIAGTASSAENVRHAQIRRSGERHRVIRGIAGGSITGINIVAYRSAADKNTVTCGVAGITIAAGNSIVCRSTIDENTVVDGVTVARVNVAADDGTADTTTSENHAVSYGVFAIGAHATTVSR